MKLCKGTGKAKGYGCGKPNLRRKYGLGISECRCYADWLYNSPESKHILKKAIKTAEKRIYKRAKEEYKEKKINLKSIRGLIVEAKEPFQKLIRIRDYRKKCICCDNILPLDLGAYDAGHLFKAEIYSGLIFNPDNVHGQRKYCNKYLGGNEAAYTLGIKERIGIQRYESLVELSIKYKSYNWNRHKLIELKKHYLSELRLVESGKKDIDSVDFSVGIVDE